ncbi:alpha/beta hydrolase [Mycolicibacterium anyangense]|uniref:Alpha/beta hydrolase n=1 Tax=Mycolicibacterium anyangense TaxID=1431246 RepID=A0A6N4W4K6_9MYCO|nr:alpha/beta hydrolase [Mycolicibacterium anyangense]BBZ75478.1 alpha/beta hydrolase [Mycolicibacterium anyangense]
MQDSYDEFGFLTEISSEVGFAGPLPRVTRVRCTMPDGTSVSGIQWGEDPQLAFLHGGGQNAHTWDSVIMALGVSALAVDLPGHGHSDWRPDRDYWPVRSADAVSRIIAEYAPNAAGVVGMSLGGLTTIRLAATNPELVRRSVIIDVTPSVFARQAEMTTAQRGTTALVSGPRVFESLANMVAAATARAPHRSEVSIRRGVRHNAKMSSDGKWTWRYDDLDPAGEGPPDFSGLWLDLDAATTPIALVVGGNSAFVAEEDCKEFARRRPDALIVTIDGAGHSVQSDQPVALARFLRSFLFASEEGD